MAFRAAAMIESRCMFHRGCAYLPPSAEEQLEVNTPWSILLMWWFFKGDVVVV
jgi:hypothetical protein